MLGSVVVDDLGSKVAENGGQFRLVCNIDLIEARLWVKIRLFATTFIPEIINDGNGVPGCNILIDDMRADKTCPASYKDFHDSAAWILLCLSQGGSAASFRV